MAFFNKHDLIIILLLLFERIDETVNRTCDWTSGLESRSGVITTPNYPTNYPTSIACIWRINAPAGHYIELTIHDFDIEPYTECKTDVLEIKDGALSIAPLLGPPYCNSRQPPKVVTSSRNHMRLWFHSDSTLRFRGFNATYKAVLDEPCVNKNIDASHGVVTSPRFPHNYPRQQTCDWKIKVSPGKLVLLKFLIFEMEIICPVGSPCRCLDYVTIKDGHSSDAKVLGRHCSTTPLPIVASTNELLIQFKSDRYGVNQGFKAVFTQTSTRMCGGDFFESNGTIESPFFDMEGTTAYPPYSDCIWVITVESNEYVSINFLFMDVLTSTMGDCSSDFVEVRDGGDTDAPLIGRYCNAHIPRTVSSSERQMFVRFISNRPRHQTQWRKFEPIGKGFRLRFQSHSKSCTASLGMEDYRISDADVFATSSFKLSHRPYALSATLARLNGAHAWCSQTQKFRMEGEYLQINFKSFTEITSLALQGFHAEGEDYFVTKYKLQYQLQDGTFRYYVDHSDALQGRHYTVLQGNQYFNITKVDRLEPSIVLKRFRILPIEYVTGGRACMCMRIELFGCNLGNHVDILTKPSGHVTYNNDKSINQTWVISPTRQTTGNTVLLFDVVFLTADCRTSGFVLSYASKDSETQEVYCGARRPRVAVLPLALQTWVRLYVKSKSIDIRQRVDFKYQLEDLGLGWVFRDKSGLIRGNRRELARACPVSIWLINLRSGRGINLKFYNIRLPKGSRSVLITVKAGLFASSPVLIRLTGSLSFRSLILLGTELRIEYQDLGNPGRGLTSPWGAGESFTIRYSTWNGNVR